MVNYIGAFKSASTAHARSESQTSLTILRSKKRLLLLVLMPVPVILWSIAFADNLPSISGGCHAYSPLFYGF